MGRLTKVWPSPGNAGESYVQKTQDVISEVDALLVDDASAIASQGARLSVTESDISLLVRGPVVNVCDAAYGAVGDGAAIDSAALKLAIAAAGVGGFLLFPHGKTFVIDTHLAPLAGQTWWAYGAKLKRRDVVSTTTTGTASVNTVTVTSTAGFRVGMSVSLWDGTTNETSNRVITNISGNTITTSTAWTINFPSGATLYSSTTLITVGATKTDGWKLLGMELDGNRANNTVTAQFENHCEIYVYGDRTIIRDCYSHDALSEGFVPAGDDVQILNNIIENCGGNGIHLSATHRCRIVGNTVRNANLAGTAPGHADGCITASDQVYDTLIDGNNLIGGISAIGSWDQSDNLGLTITNNTIRDSGTYALELSCPSGQYTEAIVIANNRFYDAKQIVLNQTNGSTPADVGPRRVIIAGNYLENTKIFATRAFDLAIKDNAIHLPSGDTTTIAIAIAGGTVEVEGNTIRNGSMGIYATLGIIRVADNRIINAYNRGISMDTGADAIIQDNVVRSDNSAATGYLGIVLQNGNTARDNTVIAAKGQYGILAPNGGSGVAGAVVADNVVRTPSGMPSIRAAGGSQNNIIKGNYVVEAISNSGTNTVSDNTTIL